MLQVPGQHAEQEAEKVITIFMTTAQFQITDHTDDTQLTGEVGDDFVAVLANPAPFNSVA